MGEYRNEVRLTLKNRPKTSRATRQFVREILGQPEVDEPAMTAEEQAWEEYFEWLTDITIPPGCYVTEYWDPAKHPRTNAPPNAGWFASTDGGRSDGGTSSEAGHGQHSEKADTADHKSSPQRTRDAIVNDLHHVNRALRKWKESAQNAWIVGPSQAEKHQLHERMRQLLDELEPHLEDHELAHVAAWRELQNVSKNIHDRLKNIDITPSIRGDIRSPEELKAAAREARFQFLLSKNTHQWWRMSNDERFELQQEITARAETFRNRYHDEAGYSFFMRQLDKLVNPAWRGMGNMDDLLTALGGAAPALRSPVSKLPHNTRPAILAVTPATTVPMQPLKPNAAATTLPRGIEYEGTVTRAVQSNHASTAWGIHPGNVAANHRYSKPGQSALYAGSSQDAVLAELKHYGVDANLVSWVSKRIKLRNVLDLTNPTVRQQLGVSLEDLTGDSYHVTQAIGDRARREYDGLIVPSARHHGSTNIVIFPRGN